MRVKNLKHPFMLQAVVILGKFSDFLMFCGDFFQGLCV
jgi:hypothetical protein